MVLPSHPYPVFYVPLKEVPKKRSESEYGRKGNESLFLSRLSTTSLWSPEDCTTLSLTGPKDRDPNPTPPFCPIALRTQTGRGVRPTERPPPWGRVPSLGTARRSPPPVPDADGRRGSAVSRVRVGMGVTGTTQTG